MDNFDKRMAAIEPAVSMKVPNRLGADGGGEKLSVNLKFTKMDDFSPAAHRPPGSGDGQALQAREQLSNLLRYMDGKAAAEDSLKKLLADPELMAAMKTKLEQKPAGDGCGAIGVTNKGDPAMASQHRNSSPPRQPSPPWRRRTSSRNC